MWDVINFALFYANLSFDVYAFLLKNTELPKMFFHSDTASMTNDINIELYTK